MNPSEEILNLFNELNKLCEKPGSIQGAVNDLRINKQLSGLHGISGMYLAMTIAYISGSENVILAINPSKYSRGLIKLDRKVILKMIGSNIQQISALMGCAVADSKIRRMRNLLNELYLALDLANNKIHKLKKANA